MLSSVTLFLLQEYMFQWIKNSEARLIKINFPQEPGLNLNTDQMEEGE